MNEESKVNHVEFLNLRKIDVVMTLIDKDKEEKELITNVNA